MSAPDPTLFDITQQPKECLKCNRVLPASEFTRARKRKDGLHQWCKQCTQAYRDVYYGVPEVRESKVCNKCGRDMPIDSFHRNRNRRNSWCKECANAHVREFYKKHKERSVQYARNRRRRLKDKGLCPACGKFEQAPNRTRCAKCLAGALSEKRKAQRKAQMQRVKDEVFAHYGGYVCQCCGEFEPVFLSLDHVYNDGAEHRRQMNPNGRSAASSTMYAWIKRNGFPLGFQVLCFNCNMGKHLNKGTCPHQSKRG